MVVYIYFPVLGSCQTACTVYCHPYYVLLPSGVSVASKVRPIITVYSKFYDICVYIHMSVCTCIAQDCAHLTQVLLRRPIDCGTEGKAIGSRTTSAYSFLHYFYIISTCIFPRTSFSLLHVYSYFLRIPSLLISSSFKFINWCMVEVQGMCLRIAYA